ncbi:amino acid ABC transporter substrate-binding protein [Verminephrobacter aporrectodeae subsp. tuberculatae]|uniref:Amino acid ABC transporter substrate-binding protein n=1 Tax=Verminephrobacter aporrectodeae subsp. tuberculatae TaxID=1110392 RepID=A0ABT3KT03_9BURK|nr:ABC transporter substrate-binding protein [Verminephrobacter aporrectodeae]MCW5321370.1 amino acid ABC transporter substrate-binding protein [Verminephrobacter aporrectodeae subsp. tuberculatae]
MKLFKAVATALALCAAFLAQARTLDEVKKDGKILIATEGQFAPFNFFDGSTLTGFEVDVAELVAKKMGLRIEWKTLGFDALLTGLRQDRWDLVIASHGITEERAKAVTFTDPHYCSGGMIIAMDPVIKNARDLAGKVVAVQTGTSYLENVQKVSSIKEMKNFPTDMDARSALVSHRVDAWVTDRFVAKAIAQKNPGVGFKLGDMLFIERIAAAVAKGNASLASGWNKALAEVLADGSYAALSKKYFDEDVRCH